MLPIQSGTIRTRGNIHNGRTTFSLGVMLPNLQNKVVHMHTLNLTLKPCMREPQEMIRMFNWAKVATAAKPIAATIDQPTSGNVHQAACDRNLETLDSVATVRTEENKSEQ